MLLDLHGLLNEAQLNKIAETLAQGSFADGRASAGRTAAKVKRNEEWQGSPELTERLYRILMSALGHSQPFRSAALPSKVADFIVSRYRPGMTYGDHIDEPVMGAGGPRLRSDLSMTVFLNPPDQYQGGELVIHTGFGVQEVKLAAGDAVLYPSSSLHRVAEVTAGERLVALTWIQSDVRDPSRREVLHELDKARQYLLGSDPESEHAKQVDRSYANLLRMWADV